MANRGKRISELTALESASLQTTLVGVDNGTTYKVTLDVLEDAIISMVSRSTDLRLDSLEAYTASVTASSIPLGTISSSTQISDFGFISSSHTDITSLNSFTSSQSVLNTAFTNGINARLQTSSFNEFSESINGRVDSLESWSSSLTDTFATDLEVSIVSSSVAATIGIISQNAGLVSTSSFNEYTASQSTSSLVDRLESIESISGSWITESETGSFLTSLNGAISSSEQVLGSSGVYSSSAQITGNIYSAGSSVTIQDILVGAGTTFGKITTDGSKYISVMPTYNVESARFWANGNVTIQDAGTYVDNGYRLEVSGSTRIVGSFDVTDGITGSTNFDTIVNKPTLISGSSQLTSSFDERYTLSGSVQNIELPENLVSSSAQITAFGFISSSQTIDSGSFATTGSNTFNGDETISGSLFISGTTELGGNIVPKTARGATLGTSDRPFSEIFVSSGSINIASDIPGDPNTTLTNIGGNILVSAGGMRLVGDASFIAATGSFGYISGSMTQVGDYSQTGDYIMIGNKTITGSIDITGTYKINGVNVLTGSQLSVDSITFDRTAGINVTEGQMAWNNSDGTLDIGLNYGDVVLQVGQEQHFVVRNETGVVIENGTAVYASGVTAGSKRIEASPFTADGSVREVRFLGLATHDISNGVNGIVSHFGYVRGLDTRGTSVTAISVGDETWVEGDILYAHPTAAGKLTNVPPKHKIYVAIITTRHQNTGVLFVRPSSYGHIDDVHDVRITTGSLVTGSMLEWNGDYFVNNDTFSSSVDNRLDTLENSTGSYLTSLSGAISSSSQLTSSFDTRYTLSGSVVSGTTPAGTISGSSQLTSSFDGRYVQTGSFNTLTASFNSFTASAQSVTTGSNSFNGTQTITGSLIITTGSFVASQILANTASLYLTSGSNMYVQNNGLVEITGSLNVSGTSTLKGAVTIGTGSGFEGGEISLAYAQTGNTTLTGSAIAFDIYGDKLRIFEGGGTNRGTYLNVASQSAGVGSEIVTSPNVSMIQTITSASYAALTPVSGTLYIIIG